MSYCYAETKPRLFTEQGSVLFTAVRDHVKRLLKQAGAVRGAEAMAAPHKGCCDSWELLACLDRMVELGELRELTGPEVWGQHRVFVEARP